VPTEAALAWRDRVLSLQALDPFEFDEQTRCESGNTSGGQFAPKDGGCEGDPTKGAGPRNTYSLRGASSSERHALWMLRNHPERVVGESHGAGRSQYRLQNGWTVTMQRAPGGAYHTMTVTRAGDRAPEAPHETQSRMEEDARRAEEERQAAEEAARQAAAQPVYERDPSLPNAVDRQGAVDSIHDFRVAGARLEGNMSAASLVSRIRSDTPESRRVDIEHVGPGHTRFTLPSGATLDVVAHDRGVTLVGNRPNSPAVQASDHANPPLQSASTASTAALREQAASQHAGTDFTPSDRQATEALLRSTFEGTHGGLESKVTSTQFGTNGVRVSGLIHDQSTGRSVGTFTRQFSSDGRTVTHEYLQLQPEVQGNGFANGFNRQAESYYAAHGVGTVNVHADIDVGGYTWASQGFNWRSAGDRSQFDYRLRDIVRNGYDQNGRDVHPDHVEQARSMLASGNYSAHELSKLGSDRPYERQVQSRDRGTTKTITSWLGKDMMLGTDWFGRKTVATRAAVRASADLPPDQPESDEAADARNAWVQRKLAERGDSFAPGWVNRRPSDYNLWWLYVDLEPWPDPA
jgi:hypothetical protein